MLDPDNDGTVDLAEAKAVDSAAFDRPERDHDGTLDRSELHDRLNTKDLTAADPDKDGTLDKAEYLALVEQRFRPPIPTKTARLTPASWGRRPVRSWSDW
jgi:hypothetical protein